ncbi:primosomal replication protein N [Alkalimonas collagenimarina]|jgi:primosomal replication protein N|uniref:Replication restart protein PriB n=1 Tax=Alkalimonas collagenimarina TaxID=400390 RepID=A0ABT9GYZ9_9GAMM|nr:primosomal replication protein N [Alkalimonas collagenimarina]MCH8536256.1 primosomal replication protein N [Alkalimonas sp.]MDP4536281.1 primosomal replication protein N [Alkalimonas collagenimarina]
MDNQLVCAGQLCRQPSRSESPAGIPHVSLVLEHRSQQQEAGLSRQCYVRIQVICSGDLAQQTQHLMLGDTVRVQGFLNRHQQRNGQSKLVLHAQHIEQIR